MGLSRAVAVSLTMLLVAAFGVFAQAQTRPRRRLRRSQPHMQVQAARRGSVIKNWAQEKERGRQAPTADRIGDSMALSSPDHISATPSGKWEYATVVALEYFQSTHGLNAWGSWMRLR